MSRSNEKTNRMILTMFTNWAHDVSMFSKSFQKHGCIISNYSCTRVLSMGWNGGAAGQSDLPTDGESSLISAATNAMLTILEKEKGMRLFMTQPPTPMEAKQFVNFGLHAVYYMGVIKPESLRILYDAKIKTVLIKEMSGEA